MHPSLKSGQARLDKLRPAASGGFQQSVNPLWEHSPGSVDPTSSASHAKLRADPVSRLRPIPGAKLPQSALPSRFPDRIHPPQGRARWPRTRFARMRRIKPGPRALRRLRAPRIPGTQPIHWAQADCQLARNSHPGCPRVSRPTRSPTHCRLHPPDYPGCCHRGQYPRYRLSSIPTASQ